jgi:hypothetical protein
MVFTAVILTLLFLKYHGKLQFYNTLEIYYQSIVIRMAVMFYSKYYWLITVKLSFTTLAPRFNLLKPFYI